MPGLTPRDDMNPYGNSIYAGHIRKTPNNDPYVRTVEVIRDDEPYRTDNVYRQVVKNGTNYGDYSPDQTNMYDGKYDMRNSEPSFECDHLATFDVGTRNGILHPEDGLRKLRQMENSMGIWTMRCVLVVERRHLVVLDNGTGEEIERFPLQYVNEPTAIFKNDKKEVYNNLVLFTIFEDPKRRNSLQDMHVFQSIGVPAQDVVDEIIAAQSGQARIHTGGRIPPPPLGPPPEPPGQSLVLAQSTMVPQNRRGYDLSESRYIVSGGGGGLVSGGGVIGRDLAISRNRASIMREENEAGHNEALERDVQLLNHCFDDIEKFVSRLQQAAESYKELEKRKRERGGKKNKRVAGDGMLGLRARPPPAQDFVDIFQKFKFSFILLAKLKAHIHDPNAPELVHFLFTPLSLIYEASRDPIHGGQDLPDQAVFPILTLEAKQLLLHCLTSKEQELWQVLGRYWTMTRNEYDGRMQSYMPRFYDGWQPASGWLDDTIRERQPTAALGTAVAAQALQIERRHGVEEERRRLQETVVPFPPENGDRYGRTVVVERRERDYDTRPPRAITPPPVVLGNTIGGGGGAYQSYEVDHITRTTKHRTEPSQMALSSTLPRDPVPKTRAERNTHFGRELKDRGTKCYVVEHDRQGRNQKELTVEKGDILEVLDDSRNWWKVKNCEGEIGYTPYTLLKPYERGDDYSGDKDGFGFSRERPGSGVYNSHLPNSNGHASTPAAPPLPSNSRPESEEIQSINSARSLTPPRSLAGSHKSPKQDELHDELRLKMSLSGGQGAKILRNQGAAGRINESSIPEEVLEWMHLKGFSDMCINTFEGYCGKDIFNLKRDEMERLVGREEAARLESHLTVQKNLAGYQTRGRNELQAVLQQRKQRADIQNVEYRQMPSFRPDSPPDYSSDSEGSSNDLDNTGRTLRDLLRRQRQKISSKQFQPM